MKKDDITLRASVYVDPERLEGEYDTIREVELDIGMALILANMDHIRVTIESVEK